MNYIHLTETQAIDIGNILARYSKYIEYKLEELNIKKNNIDPSLSEIMDIDIANLTTELNLIKDRCKNLGLEL